MFYSFMVVDKTFFDSYLFLFFQYSKLGKTELQTAKILGLTESCAIRLLNNQPIKVFFKRHNKQHYYFKQIYFLECPRKSFE